MLIYIKNERPRWLLTKRRDANIPSQAQGIVRIIAHESQVIFGEPIRSPLTIKAFLLGEFFLCSWRLFSCGGSGGV